MLCFSGDHRGLCEVGQLFTKLSGCRRYKPESVCIPETNHYYYPNFRKQACFRAEKKSIMDNLELFYDSISLKEVATHDSLSYIGCITCVAFCTIEILSLMKCMLFTSTL